MRFSVSLTPVNPRAVLHKEFGRPKSDKLLAHAPRYPITRCGMAPRIGPQAGRIRTHPTNEEL